MRKLGVFLLVFLVAAIAFADFCPKCGKNVDSSANFCPGCGARLGGGSNQQQQQQQQQQVIINVPGSGPTQSESPRSPQVLYTKTFDVSSWNSGNTFIRDIWPGVEYVQIYITPDVVTLGAYRNGRNEEWARTTSPENGQELAYGEAGYVVTVKIEKVVRAVRYGQEAGIKSIRGTITVTRQ